MSAHPVLDPLDPNDTLDYSIDWSKWLGGDTISASTWTVNGATVSSSTYNTTSTTVWVNAGVIGSLVRAVNQIVTALGRTKKKTITFMVEDT